MFENGRNRAENHNRVALPIKLTSLFVGVAGSKPSQRGLRKVAFSLNTKTLK